MASSFEFRDVCVFLMRWMSCEIVEFVVMYEIWIFKILFWFSVLLYMMLLICLGMGMDSFVSAFSLIAFASVMILLLSGIFFLGLMRMILCILIFFIVMSVVLFWCCVVFGWSVSIVFIARDVFVIARVSSYFESVKSVIIVVVLLKFWSV